ncbi:sigma-54-dependent transcriptional regulator [Ottowia thiooxydans]|uniref:DNA-binding NtrC family response regulator n=1 Tax=Ottowia thiooxydans TaxID=219182 RepID=A0ABV2QHR4_9BURK
MDHVLIVDADIESATRLRGFVASEQFSVVAAHSLRDARKQMILQTPQLVFLDSNLPDGNGLDLISESHVSVPPKLVLMTAQASVDSAVEALRMGAMDYLVKPISSSRVEFFLSGLGRGDKRREEPEQHGRFGKMWGTSAPMRKVYEQIQRVASTSITVLVTGESGTGKELVAQTVHELSSRKDMPFLAVNCGAISPNLIESEIFGHEKGSFTGAERQHQGFFERAAGGTLFLDEVTEMPLDLQVKLLRVLETGRFMRVGSTQSREADVRVVAATNRVPEQAVADGKLREDVFYRLNVFPIELPPLRERLSDLPLLAEHFLRDVCAQEGRSKEFNDAALKQLALYPWPGNVRELRNAVQRAYVMAPGEVIGPEWLPEADSSVQKPGDIARLPEKRKWPEANGISIAESTDTSERVASVRVPIGFTMDQAEKMLIQATLKQCMYQKERTAAVLGISLKTLYNRLKSYAASNEGAEKR